MNNEKTLDFENMTTKQICSCLGLLNKLVEENIIKFDINKSEAVLNYDEAVRCIEKQNKLYKSTLDKIKEFCNEQIKLANIEIDECCRWRNADKEKYIITKTNLSKAFLIKKCNKRILRVMDLVENDKYYNAIQIYEEELLEEIE